MDFLVLTGESLPDSSLMEVRGELKALDGAVLGVRQKLPPLPLTASMLVIEVFSLRGEKKLSVDNFLPGAPGALICELSFGRCLPGDVGR